MGKKSRKKNNFIASAVRSKSDQHHRDNVTSAFKKMDEVGRLSLQEQKDTFRNALIGMGTDVNQNDNDPTGDGDQSPITTQAQRDAAVEMYSIGGDIHAHMEQNAISKFALWCSMGSLDMVKKTIQDLQKEEVQPFSRKKKMEAMMETRETSLRLSPLLLIVSAGKNVRAPRVEMQNHQETAKYLLLQGASPLAKDVLGKTVCHYGAGAMATNMTLDVVDMCIRAAETHYMYGMSVELRGLKAEEMNGKVGIAGGFDVDSGRRSIFLPEEKREVWIKTENIKPEDTSIDPKAIISLTNIQDRLGTVSLHEVVMRDRVDVAEFLLQKHRTSIRTEDLDGISPFRLASGMGRMAAARVSNMIHDAARKEGRDATKAKKQQSKYCCAKCRHDLGGGSDFKCARCKIARYCGRECQVAHWGDHKRECKELLALSSGVKLDPPIATGMQHMAMNFATGSSHSKGDYQKPRNVDYEKKFVIKVQATSEHSAIMVYDETRSCAFDISPGQPGFREVLEATRKEMAWQGRKTFMKAAFDRSGTCTVYPGTAGVKSHYTW